MMEYELGYRYFDKTGKKPLFPFGFGLSYTKFTYANLVVPCSTVSKNGVVNVQVEITNSGTVKGDEVALLFVSYPGTTKTRSVKELKGFAPRFARSEPDQAHHHPAARLGPEDDDKTSKRLAVDPAPCRSMVDRVGGPPAQQYLHGELNLFPFHLEEIDTNMNFRSAWSLVWAAVAVPPPSSLPAPSQLRVTSPPVTPRPQPAPRNPPRRR